MDRRKRYRQIVALMSMLSKTETIDNVDIAAFYGNGTNLLSLIVGVDPVQDLHGYDSPWPAGGGANKWNEDWEQGTINISNGVHSSATTAIRSKSFSVAQPETTYYIYCGAGSSRFYVAVVWYDSSYNYISGKYSNRETVTSPANAAYFKITTNLSDYVYGGTYNNNIAVNNPSTVTTYSPYSNICPISGWDAVSIWNKPTHDTTADPTVTIQLGETVYGGTLDVVNGTLTVDRAMVVYDGSTDEWWNIPASSKPWLVYGNLPSDMAMGNADSLLVKSDAFKTSTRAWSTSTYGILNNYSNIVVGYPPCNGDVSVFKSYLTDHPLTVVYKLATPITIDLDPVQIATIANRINNIWADTGKIIFLEYEA